LGGCAGEVEVEVDVEGRRGEVDVEVSSQR
jgi:hypothetical protein